MDINPDQIVRVNVAQMKIAHKSEALAGFGASTAPDLRAYQRPADLPEHEELMQRDIEAIAQAQAQDQAERREEELAQTRAGNNTIL